MDFDLLRQRATGTVATFPAEDLAFLAEEAFARLSFTFTRAHLDRLIAVANGPASSANDRLVAVILLRNAAISARGALPLCQDTGIACVFGWRDAGITVDGDETGSLARGVERAYASRHLRFSTTVPSSLFDESDPGNNLPAQITLFASGNGATGTADEPARTAYRFLFCAKGGGSSNKTSLTQATKAILSKDAFDRYLREEIPRLGVAACPPYKVCVVVGGLSPEQNLLALKLATADGLEETSPGWPTDVLGAVPIRVREWESRVLEIAAETGLGAQFGGTALAAEARVYRLPRHGASCPVSIGVSCSAHRNLKGYIDRTGIYLERTVARPEDVPGFAEAVARSDGIARGALSIDLSLGIESARSALAGIEPGTPVLLSGPLLVARDAAHARWRRDLAEKGALPDYVARYPIMYAGPAETPPGYPLGSFGPTTAGRMDEYADELMSNGAALVTVAKGNRSEGWRAACGRYRATYLGTVGGAAALIAAEHVVSAAILDYPDLGMEAVRLVEVKNLPAFVLINDRGEDFYRSLKGER